MTRSPVRALGAATAMSLMMMAMGCGALSGEETVVTRNPALQDAIANEAIFGEEALTINADVATCIGREAYERLGPERLDALGVTVEQPSLGPILEEAGDLVGDCRLSAVGVADGEEADVRGDRAADLEPPEDDAAEQLATESEDESEPEREPTEAATGKQPGLPEGVDVESIRLLIEGPDALTSDPEAALCLVRGMAELGPVAVSDTGFPVVGDQDGARVVALLDQCGFDAETVFVEAVASASNAVPIEVARCLPTSLEAETWRGWLADGLVNGDLDPLGDLSWDHVWAVGFISCV